MLLHMSRRDVKAMWIAVVVLRRGQKVWKNLTLFWNYIECTELGKWFIYEVRKKEILGMPVSSLACENEGWWHSHWDSNSRSKAKHGGNLIVVLATQWNGVIGKSGQICLWGRWMALKLRRHSGLQILISYKLQTSAYKLLSLLIFTILCSSDFDFVL